MTNPEDREHLRVRAGIEDRQATFSRLLEALRHRKAITPCGTPPYGREFLQSMSISGIEFGTIVTEHPAGMSADIASLSNSDISADLNQAYTLGDQGVFLRLNIEDPLPLEDGSVDWVFAEHIIEHVSPLAAIRWLAEVRRILRPGGLARIVTPDLAKYVDGYRGGTFFATHRAYLEQAGLHGMPDRPAFMMNQIFYLWGHKWIYDAAELAHAATQAGFAADGITHCEFGQGQRADVCALDRPLRKDESVYVELTR